MTQTSSFHTTTDQANPDEQTVTQPSGVLFPHRMKARPRLKALSPSHSEPSQASKRSEHEDIVHSLLFDPFTTTYIRIKARQLCSRTDFSLTDDQDLRQEMRLHLIEKAHLFDPQRGNLEAFVTQCINSWVGMQLRYRDRCKRSEEYKAVSLERTEVLCDGVIDMLGDVLLEEDGGRRTRTYAMSAIEDFELRDAMEFVLNNLKPRDLKLLKYVAEHGPSGAPQAIGLTRAQVDESLARIREIMEKSGLN
jgi:hypothetical protein